MSSTPVTTSAAASSKSHAPLFSIIGGVVLIAIWLLANSVQIQTSEVWILAKFTGINVLGGFSVYGQVVALFSGTMTPNQVISYMYAYTVQAAYMFCAVEVDLPQNRRSKVLWSCIVGLVILNTLGDFNYASQAGLNVWGQIGFALAMLVASFGFGLAGVSVLLKGITTFKA